MIRFLYSCPGVGLIADGSTLYSCPGVGLIADGSTLYPCPGVGLIADGSTLYSCPGVGLIADVLWHSHFPHSCGPSPDHLVWANPHNSFLHTRHRFFCIINHITHCLYFFTKFKTKSFNSGHGVLKEDQTPTFENLARLVHWLVDSASSIEHDKHHDFKILGMTAVNPTLRKPGPSRSMSNELMSDAEQEGEDPEKMVEILNEILKEDADTEELGDIDFSGRRTLEENGSEMDFIASDLLPAGPDLPTLVVECDKHGCFVGTSANIDHSNIANSEGMAIVFDLEHTKRQSLNLESTETDHVGTGKKNSSLFKDVFNGFNFPSAFDVEPVVVFPQGHAVIAQSDEDMTTLLKKNAISIVLFCGKNCPKCQQLGPGFLEIAKNSKSTYVSFNEQSI